MARRIWVGTTVPDRAGCPVCGVLCQRRARLLPCSGLAEAGQYPRLVHGVSRPHQWPTNARGSGLVGALTYFGLDAIGASEKDDMRVRILRGGPWSESEREEILDYCATDTDALERLLPAMLADALISRAPYCAVATWPRPPPWNGTVCPSTPPL